MSSIYSDEAETKWWTWDLGLHNYAKTFEALKTISYFTFSLA